LFPKDKDPESVMGISGRFRSFCPGFSGTSKELLRTEFLRFNRSLIDVTRRSVSRGLGLPVTFPMIVNSGLWTREAWYLSLEVEKPIPAPFASWSNPPPGFKFIRVAERTKEISEAEEGLAAAFVEAAWMSPKGGVNDWFSELKLDSYDYGHWFHTRSHDLKKRAKLLGLSPRNTQRFLKPRRSLFKDEAWRANRVGVWVKEDFVPNLTLVRSNEYSCHSDLEQFDITQRTSARRSFDATERQFDHRDYLNVSIQVDEIFLETTENSLTTSDSAEVFHGDLGLNLKRYGDIAVRCFARGVGLAPPPCLC